MTIQELIRLRTVLRSCMFAVQGDEQVIDIIEREIRLKEMDPRKTETTETKMNNYGQTN